VVIFGVRQKTQREDSLLVKVDRSDQAKTVTRDIENKYRPATGHNHSVHRDERLSDIREPFPFRSADHDEPTLQTGPGHWISLHPFSNRAGFDHTHVAKMASVAKIATYFYGCRDSNAA
jgi:hypothetical protein